MLLLNNNLEEEPVILNDASLVCFSIVMAGSLLLLRVCYMQRYLITANS